METTHKVSRLGMFTASSIHALMTKGKAKDQLFGQAALTYIHEKVAEIITGESKQQASSFSLEWGNNMEKDAYQWLNNIIPHEYLGKENFKFFEYNEFSGGSPDGLSDTHVFEYKCPFTSSNHIQWLVASKNNKPDHGLLLYKLDAAYYAQVQFNMLCTKRDNAVFASYDPRTVNHEHRMALLYIERDNDFLDELKMRIDEGVKIIQQTLTTINSSVNGKIG